MDIDMHEFNLEKAKKIGLKTPSKKYNHYNKKQLEIGTKEEFEHTDDPEVAVMIAAVHLDEDPSYYTKLSKAMASDAIIKIANSINEDMESAPLNTPKQEVSDAVKAANDEWQRIMTKERAAFVGKVYQTFAHDLNEALYALEGDKPNVGIALGHLQRMKRAMISEFGIT